MEKDDVQLIQNILASDETAFSTLVKKIRKRRSRVRLAESR